MTKSGEPYLHSSPGKKHHKVKVNIGPRRRMQQRTYPFVSVILSPGSKIGHTPRKNPSPSGAGNLPHQRISRLAQDACNYLHKPFAAKKDYNTASHKLQVFFGIFANFFLQIFYVLPKPAGHAPSALFLQKTGQNLVQYDQFLCAGGKFAG